MSNICISKILVDLETYLIKLPDPIFDSSKRHYCLYESMDYVTKNLPHLSALVALTTSIPSCAYYKYTLITLGLFKSKIVVKKIYMCLSSISKSINQ